jgi:hypothetical protein
MQASRAAMHETKCRYSKDWIRGQLRIRQATKILFTSKRGMPAVAIGHLAASLRREISRYV